MNEDEKEDKYKVEAAPEIGFECGACEGWSFGHTDTLERNGEHVEGRSVESDRIECNACGVENFVYRRL